MSNPYVSYYQNQIGKGILGFKGIRHQRGYGFLTSLITKAISPIFKTIKNVDPSSIVRAAGDILKGPGLTPGIPLADDIARIGATATGTFINKLQSGKGLKYKKKRRMKIKSVTKKQQRCKRRKRNIKKRKTTKRKLKYCKRKIKSCKKRCFKAKPKNCKKRLFKRKFIDALGS